MVPGTMVDVILATAEERIDRELIEQRLGLDVSIPVQYGRWIGVLPQSDGEISGILQGNLQDSWWTKTSVSSLIADAFPITLMFGLMAIIFGQIIALPIGIYSAIRQNTAGDYLGRSFAILLISVPSFWVGTMVIVFPSVWWGYMPPMALSSFIENPIDNLKMLVVPAIVLAMHLCGTSMRLTRTMMLEVLRQDYIRTAWAKGLKEKVIVVRHALKNGLFPVITQIGIQVPFVLGGTVILENIFMLPGMGRLIISAIEHRDYPLVSGVMLVLGAILVLTNLLVDLTYAFLDPRVRYR
jgi:peptide/nickel transport system permease protein